MAETLEKNLKQNIDLDRDDRNQTHGIDRWTFLNTAVVTVAGVAAMNLGHHGQEEMIGRPSATMKRVLT